MNSAEKKATEPSMDDIISSIRNIIADDTKEADPASAAETVQNAVPPVVQLTENQITGQGPGDGTVASPGASTDIDPLANAAIAQEIDAIPSAPAPAAEAVISDVVNDNTMAQSAPVTPPVAEAIVSEPLPQIDIVPASSVPAIETQSLPSAGIDPVSSVPVSEPDVQIDQAHNEMANIGLQQEAAPIPVVAEPLVPALDPVEEMMQGDVRDVDGVNAEIDPDKILDGMAPVGAKLEVSASPVPETPAPSAVEPVIDTPVVLDASQVSAEDAAAITAVATATSEALAGRTEPDEKQGSHSLEDSVKEMLKPMIREWLNDNMPRILEGAIKEEVKTPGSDNT